MAREGIYFYLPFLAIAAFFFYLFNRSLDMNYVYLGAFMFFVGNLVLLFFRDPNRRVPNGENLVVSPADGKIIVAESSNGKQIISIFMSVLDVHINRVPVTGIVERVEHKPGKFKAAFRSDALDVNERMEIEIKTDKGNVVMHQVAGVIARRVVCRLKKGQSVKAGDRLGLIRFGSRVDLFLPPEVKLEVNIGQKVKGAKTLIGRFN